MPTPAELDEQINQYAARQGTGLPVPADIPAAKSPLVTGNTGFDVNLSNKQWPKGSFKGESASAVQGPVEGLLSAAKGTLDFVTPNNEASIEARRAASRQGLDSSTETAAPAAARPAAQPTPPAALPGTVDKTPRVVTPPAAGEGSSAVQPAGTGSRILGVSRVGNSFSQTDAGSAAALPAAPGDLLKGAAPVPGVDAFGNSTAITQYYQGKLDTARQESADRQAEWDKQFAGKPSYAQQQQADADSFTRFVNESATARLAHDLGTGGGDAKSNAGKIAALNAMQHRDAAARGDATARAGQMLTADTARGQQAVLSKGQLLQHNTAMAQILGSPLHQQGQILDAAIKSGQVSQAKAMQDIQSQLIAAGKAGDTEKQGQLAVLLRQLAGKDAQEGKLISVGGGQEIDPATGMLRTLESKAVYAAPGQEPRILSASTNAKPVPAGPPPSLEQFKAHVIGKNPGVKLTDEQITAAYKQQFGGK